VRRGAAPWKLRTGQGQEGRLPFTHEPVEKRLGKKPLTSTNYLESKSKSGGENGPKKKLPGVQKGRS